MNTIIDHHMEVQFLLLYIKKQYFIINLAHVSGKSVGYETPMSQKGGSPLRTASLGSPLESSPAEGDSQRNPIQREVSYGLWNNTSYMCIMESLIRICGVGEVWVSEYTFAPWHKTSSGST